MFYGGIEFELGVRNSAALASNFFQVDRELTSALRGAVNRGSALLVEVVKALVPVDTGFMQRNVKRWRSPSGLVYEVGWKAEDFINAGHAFYPVFVEYGTRFMPAQPSLGPAAEYAMPIIQEEISDIFRVAIAGLRAA